MNDVASELADQLSKIEEIAVGAGRILVDGWGTHPATESKSAAADLVTEYDRRSEAFIVSELARAFPDFSVIAEEGQRVDRSTEQGVFFVDPLDGTINFAHALPMFAVSIGLVRQGRVVSGVVHAPVLPWTFSGAIGLGSTFNAKPISVSHVAHVAQSLVATGFSARRSDPNVNIPEFAALTAESHGTRRLGSAALDLCCVACGWLDGYWEYLLNPWDIAGGAAIVEAAGGRVTDLDCGPLQLQTGRVLATNGIIHDELSRRLGQIRSSD